MNESSSKKKQQVRIAYAPDKEGGDRMIAALKEEGIEAFRRGGVRDLYTPGEIMGEEIMVQEEDDERGRQVLSSFSGSGGPLPVQSHSVKKTVLSLAAALGLLALLLFMRGAL